MIDMLPTLPISPALVFVTLKSVSKYVLIVPIYVASIVFINEVSIISIIVALIFEILVFLILSVIVILLILLSVISKIVVVAVVFVIVISSILLPTMSKIVVVVSSYSTVRLPIGEGVSYTVISILAMSVSSTLSLYETIVFRSFN